MEESSAAKSLRRVILRWNCGVATVGEMANSRVGCGWSVVSVRRRIGRAAENFGGVTADELPTGATRIAEFQPIGVRYCPPALIA
ncbi:hypothetical protein VTN77DRAFT_2697 [Rasamsonia byssochlamydoides]|uniref:uncharacterized protein n=1 Tax=Rasamsonia byssochlamydoides TaxID=89139 RepID=UPI003743B415